MHNFAVHSNESAWRKSGCLGLEQVYYCGMRERCLHMLKPLTRLTPDKINFK